MQSSSTATHSGTLGGATAEAIVQMNAAMTRTMKTVSMRPGYSSFVDDCNRALAHDVRGLC